MVHLYTASGVVVGFLAILATEAKDLRAALLWMALAVVIDASDGTLARAARVKEVLPWFDGTLLDNIVDYFNYVAVPCLFLLRASLLPAQDAFWLISFPLLASAYGFCQRDAKTADYFFLGFPSYWNVVAFYFVVLRTPLWVNAFVTIGLSILVFVPIKFIYPSRAPRFRVSTNLCGVLWGLAILWILFTLPEPPRTLMVVSLLFPAYYTALSLWLEFQRWTPWSSD
ncbi:MAG TPA: hypothetical protein VMT22_11240 [Terriglobales bacterium]|nr:hypothetical protein [Terriglobales bacterium]